VPYIQVEPHTKSHAFHLALTAVIGLASFQAGARALPPARRRREPARACGIFGGARRRGVAA